MPFLRFSRDKRGYESIYLVHAQNRRGKPSRPRILYWYRTPPNIRVGRPPFDEETQRRLEAQNPDVAFDWPTIVSTPIPPPAENEQWRERRRAERAAKQAQRAEEAATTRDAPSPSSESPGAMDLDEPAGDEALQSLTSIGQEVETIDLEAEPHATPDVGLPAEVATLTSGGKSEADPAARRRRRRGGRRRRGRQPLGLAGPNIAVEAGNPVEPTDPSGSIEPSSDSDTVESVESDDQ